MRCIYLLMDLYQHLTTASSELICRPLRRMLYWKTGQIIKKIQAQCDHKQHTARPSPQCNLKDCVYYNIKLCASTKRPLNSFPTQCLSFPSRIRYVMILQRKYFARLLSLVCESECARSPAINQPLWKRTWCNNKHKKWLHPEITVGSGGWSNTHGTFTHCATMCSSTCLYYSNQNMYFLMRKRKKLCSVTCHWTWTVSGQAFFHWLYCSKLADYFFLFQDCGSYK